MWFSNAIYDLKIRLIDFLHGSLRMVYLSHCKGIPLRMKSLFEFVYFLKEDFSWTLESEFIIVRWKIKTRTNIHNGIDLFAYVIAHRRILKLLEIRSFSSSLLLFVCLGHRSDFIFASTISISCSLFLCVCRCCQICGFFMWIWVYRYFLQYINSWPFHKFNFRSKQMNGRNCFRPENG